MDPIKSATEHHIHIQDEKQQEKKITKEQEVILFQVHLADVLLFGAGTLNPEQQKLQEELTKEYLTNLKSGDTVEIGLQGMMPYHSGIVVSVDENVVKVKADCYLNKKKKEGIRSFSTTDGYSKGFLFMNDDYACGSLKLYYFINIPESHMVKSTAGIPQKALDEIEEIYKQAGDPKTCYDLVNNLKHGSSKDNGADLTF